MPFKDKGYGALEVKKPAAATPDSKQIEPNTPIVTQVDANAPAPTGATVAKKKLPLPNVLHKYPSYTYVWSLFCLPKDALADPPNTYLKNTSLYPCILRSSGQPSNRVNTQFGKFDFYIDNVEIHSMYGLNAKTGNSNANNFSFDVIEPFSMGLFMQAMAAAATKMNYSNYLTASYCLKLEFKGIDQYGMMVNIPKTTKFFPITIKDVTMNVTEAGASYNVVALAYAENTLLDDINKISTELQFSGATVAEALQTGPKSLQAVLNDRLRQQAAKAKVPVPDEVLILFPTETQGSAAKKQDAKEQIKPASAPPGVTLIDPGGKTLSALGVTRNAQSLSLEQGTVNTIGMSGLGYDPTRPPLTVAPATDYIYASKAGIYDQSKVNKNYAVSNNVVAQNSTITNAITQLILSSNYAINALKEKPDTAGYRRWFRIEPQMFEIETDATLNYNGRSPRLYVYRVIPYRAHSTSLPKVGQKTITSKYDQLQKNAVKVYNYIYTGANTDIISLNLEFNNMFQAVMAADNFNNGAGEETLKQDVATQYKPADIVNTPGDAKNEAGQPASPVLRNNATSFGSDLKGGGGRDLSAHRAAKLFQDGLLRGIDMLNLEMTIVGDPYWLTSSGIGNWKSKAVAPNLLEDDSADWLNGEVDMVVNFRTPVDIDPVTGLMKMAASKATKQFRGIYKVRDVVSKFKDGQFTQMIKSMRRQIDFNDTEEVTFDIIKTEPSKDVNTGEASG